MNEDEHYDWEIKSHWVRLLLIFALFLGMHKHLWIIWWLTYWFSSFWSLLDAMLSIRSCCLSMIILSPSLSFFKTFKLSVSCNSSDFWSFIYSEKSSKFIFLKILYFSCTSFSNSSWSSLRDSTSYSRRVFSSNISS